MVRIPGKRRRSSLLRSFPQPCRSRTNDGEFEEERMAGEDPGAEASAGGKANRAAAGQEQGKVMNDKPEPVTSTSWLHDKLTKLDAVYQKFGRDGLREHPLSDVSLLLSSKELAFRDLPKGRDLTEHQKAASRQLELEVKD